MTRWCSWRRYGRIPHVNSGSFDESSPSLAMRGLTLYYSGHILPPCILWVLLFTPLGPRRSFVPVSNSPIIRGAFLIPRLCSVSDQVIIYTKKMKIIHFMPLADLKVCSGYVQTMGVDQASPCQPVVMPWCMPGVPLIMWTYLYEEDVAVKWIMCSLIIHEILSDQSISRWDLLIAEDWFYLVQFMNACECFEQDLMHLVLNYHIVLGCSWVYMFVYVCINLSLFECEGMYTCIM